MRSEVSRSAVYFLCRHIKLPVIWATAKFILSLKILNSFTPIKIGI
jgi:hypothetical protein